MPSPHRRLHRTFLPRRFSGSGGFRAAPTRLLGIFWHRAAVWSAIGPIENHRAAVWSASCAKNQRANFSPPLPIVIIWLIGRRARQKSDESEQRSTWCFDAVHQPRGKRKHNGCQRQGHTHGRLVLLDCAKPISFSFCLPGVKKYFTYLSVQIWKLVHITPY